MSARYSRFLPTRMIEQYRQSLDDPELLNLREEISVVDARISDVMKRVDSGEAGTLWAKAKSAYTDIQASIATQNVFDMQRSLNIMADVLNNGLGDWHAWDEVMKLVDQRRRLVESERKRLVEMNQVISSERALLLITAIIDIIKTHITDQSILRAIVFDVETLLQYGSKKKLPEQAAEQKQVVNV